MQNTAPYPAQYLSQQWKVFTRCHVFNSFTVEVNFGPFFSHSSSSVVIEEGLNMFNKHLRAISLQIM